MEMENKSVKHLPNRIFLRVSNSIYDHFQFRHRVNLTSFQITDETIFRMVQHVQLLSNQISLFSGMKNTENIFKYHRIYSASMTKHKTLVNKMQTHCSFYSVFERLWICFAVDSSMFVRVLVQQDSRTLCTKSLIGI